MARRTTTKGGGRIERLLRQHERLRRARDHAFVWCAVFVLLLIPAAASLVQELLYEREPRVVGQLILIALAIPAIVFSARSGMRHRRALKSLSARDDPAQGYGTNDRHSPAS